MKPDLRNQSMRALLALLALAVNGLERSARDSQSLYW